MSQSIEWAHVASAPAYLLLGHEDAGDGNTPNSEIDGSDESENLALVLDGCALYGTPGELLEFLSTAVSMVSAHLAGQP